MWVEHIAVAALVRSVGVQGTAPDHAGDRGEDSGASTPESLRLRLIDGRPQVHAPRLVWTVRSRHVLLPPNDGRAERLREPVEPIVDRRDHELWDAPETKVVLVKSLGTEECCGKSVVDMHSCLLHTVISAHQMRIGLSVSDNHCVTATKRGTTHRAVRETVDRPCLFP